MSAIASKWNSGTDAQKRQKILLAVFSVVFIGLLVFEVPRLLNRSDSSTGAVAIVTPVVTPVFTDTATGGVGTAPATPAAKSLAFRHLKAKDPFAPAVVAESTAAAAPTAAATPAATTPPPTAETPTATTPEATPTSTPTTEPAPTNTVTVVAPKVDPSIAVIYTNGRRQAIAESDTFKAHDLTFRVLAVTAKTVKLALVDAALAGNKASITIEKGKPLTLVNTATGVEYTLDFKLGTSGIPTTTTAAPATVTPTAPATPAPATPAETTPADSTSTTTTTSGN